MYRVTINPLMAFSLCYIVFIDLFLDDMVVDTKKQGLKWPCWAWLAGHGLAGTMLAGLLTIYVHFSETLTYI